jgi:hypothetical protein
VNKTIFIVKQILLLIFKPIIIERKNDDRQNQHFRCAYRNSKGVEINMNMISRMKMRFDEEFVSMMYPAIMDLFPKLLP